MRNKRTNHLLAMLEGSLMIALSVVLDLLPLPSWPQGGSITVAMIPVIYFSYRRGYKWGLMAGLVHAAVQMLLGWYVPPAGTVSAMILCVLLDYVLAFALLGGADIIAGMFGSKLRLAGYTVGALTVTLIRFLCSFLSGVLLWGSYAPEGVNVWIYSLTYNASYMIPNAILTSVLIAIMCVALDPITLKPMKRNEK